MVVLVTERWDQRGDLDQVNDIVKACEADSQTRR